jgi:hypothetical protein
MTLEVIGAGFGRTGTMSLKVTIEKLGFGPSTHSLSVCLTPSDTTDEELRVITKQKSGSTR